MEDFKGTKGWNAKHESTEFCDTGDYEYHATIEDEKGRCIAQFFAKDEDQREADCNLAAAAPELLEALIKLRATYLDLEGTLYGRNITVNNWHLNGNIEPIDNFFEDLDLEAISNAKTVINKALGKEDTDE